MESLYQKQLGKLEGMKAQVIALFKKIPESDFHSRIIPGKWSPAELLEHLILVERVSLGYMRKKSQTMESLPKANLLTFVKFNLLILLLRTNLRFKAPAVVVDPISGSRSLEELMTEWETLRREMNTFYNTIQATESNRLVYRHTIGRFHAGQALEILYVHARHHYPQAKRFIRES